MKDRPPPEKKLAPLDYRPGPASGAGAVLGWAAFGLAAILTLMLSLLGMTVFSAVQLSFFISASMVIVGLGIAAVRVWGLHGALAGFLICVCIVILLFGTCSQSRYHF